METNQIFSREHIIVKGTIKVIESRYVALFVVSGSFEKLLLIDCVNIYFSQSIVFANIYFFSIYFSIDFARRKSVGYPTLLIS